MLSVPVRSTAAKGGRVPAIGAISDIVLPGPGAQGDCDGAICHDLLIKDSIRGLPGMGVEAMRRTRIVLSWCHLDRALKEALLRDLLPALGVVTDLDVEWWEDSHLNCGEELPAGIVDRLDESDFGLLLLSTRYFGRPFIRKHELPRFAGPGADKGSLPVALSPLPRFGLEHDQGGIERQLVFMRDGRSFAELSGAKRTSFANELAAAIRRRALSLTGYRTL